MATATRWGGFRPDPYNPDAVDADNDGIVQEGTLFERPVGTRFINLDGTELSEMISGTNLTDISGLQIVDRDGKRVDYRPSWSQGVLSIGQRFGSLEDRGLLSVGQLTGVVAPPKKAKKIDVPVSEIAQTFSDSELAELRSLYPEIFDSDGNLIRPFNPMERVYGFEGEAKELIRGAKSWKDVREALKGKTIIAYDYETTGFVSEGGRAVQIGAVKIVDGEVVDRINIYMDPGIPHSKWSDFSRDNLKNADGELITPEMVAGWPSTKEGHERFVEWIGGGEFYTMGHNAFTFDDRLQEIELNAAGIEGFNPAGKLDTLSISRDLIDTKAEGAISKRHTLGALAEAFGIELGDKAHTADADSEATGKLLYALLDYAEEQDLPVDLIEPNKNEPRYEEMRQKYEADKARYDELMRIHDTVKKSIDDRKRIQREASRTGVDPRPASPQMVEETEDIIGPDKMRPIRRSVDEVMTGVDDGSVSVSTQTDKKTVTVNSHGTDVEVPLYIDDDGNVAELSEQGEELLTNLSSVGRSIRTRAQRLWMGTQEGKDALRLQDALNSEERRRSAALSDLLQREDRMTLDFASRLFGRDILDIDDLDDSERDMLISALNTDVGFDSQGRRLRVEIREATEAYNDIMEQKYVNLMRIRALQKKAIVQTLYGRPNRDDGYVRRGREDLEIPATYRIYLPKSVPPEEREAVKLRSQAAVEDSIKYTMTLLPETWQQRLIDEIGISGKNLQVQIFSPDSPSLQGATGLFYKKPDGTYVIAVSSEIADPQNPVQRRALRRVVGHEIMHSMEDAIPELAVVRDALFSKRARDAGPDGLKEHDNTALMLDDDFSDPYSGVIYGGDDIHSEIFTTGFERIFLPAESQLDVPAPDQEHSDVVLGVLASIAGKDRPGALNDRRRANLNAPKTPGDRPSPRLSPSVSATDDTKSVVMDANNNPLAISVPDSPEYHGVSPTDPRGFGNPKFSELTRFAEDRDQTVRGVPISPDDPMIPETLFHVSVNAPAVRREGTLRARGSGGLGGDSRDAIVSMTVSQDTAAQLESDMKLMTQISRQVDNPDEFVRLAKTDMQKYGADMTAEQEDRLRSAIEADPSGAYRAYFVMRSSVGSKPKDPMFTDNATERFAEIDPDSIGIVNVPKSSLKTGAMVTNFDVGSGSLDEIRIYGDVNTASVEGIDATDLAPVDTDSSDLTDLAKQIIKMDQAVNDPSLDIPLMADEEYVSLAQRVRQRARDMRSRNSRIRGALLSDSKLSSYERSLTKDGKAQVASTVAAGRKIKEKVGGRAARIVAASPWRDPKNHERARVLRLNIEEAARAERVQIYQEELNKILGFIWRDIDDPAAVAEKEYLINNFNSMGITQVNGYLRHSDFKTSNPQFIIDYRKNLEQDIEALIQNYIDSETYRPEATQNIANSLRTIMDRAIQHNYDTFVTRTTREGAAIAELRDFNESLGGGYNATIARARRQAVTEIVREIDPTFGTGEFAFVDTSLLSDVIGEEETRKLLKEVQESIPKEWVDIVNARGLSLGAGKRGYYSETQRYIQISERYANSPIEGYLQVLIHEIGHAVSENRSQKDVTKEFPAIKERQEMAFAYIASEHERLKELNGGKFETSKLADLFGGSRYDDGEITAIPAALNPSHLESYLLKTYPSAMPVPADRRPNGSQEVVSMLAEYVFGGNFTALDSSEYSNPDVLSFALGFLTLLGSSGVDLDSQ